MSEANRVNLVFNRETTFKETPATPLGSELRFTSETLEHNKETVESDELRDDRQVEDLVEVGVGAQGDINLELSFGNADDLMAAALGSSFGDFSGKTIDRATIQAVNASAKFIRSDSGSWVTDGITVNQWIRTRGFSNAANNGLFKVSAVTATDLTVTSGTGTLVDEAAATGRIVQGLFGTTAVAGVNLTAANADNSFSRASGSFVTDGFVVGQRIRAFGFATSSNNAIWQITSIPSATKIIVTGSVAVANDSSAAGCALFGDHVRDGTTARSFHFERQYKDITRFVSYRGLRVGKFSLSISARQIIKAVLSLMGVKGVAAGSTVMGALTTANKNKICAAGVNVGTVKEGGSALTQACAELSWDVEAGLEAVDTIESKEHNQINLGTTRVTGRARLYFTDSTYYDKFQDHTESSFEHQITDKAGNVYYVSFPSILYSTAPIATPGKNQQIWADMNFQAISNATYGCQIMIDRIPV